MEWVGDGGGEVAWWPLVALFLAGLLSSVTSALTAFGLAIIMHVVLQGLYIAGLLEVELQDVVVYILVMGPCTLWPIFILYWKEIDWQLFAFIFPPKIVMTYVGIYILVSFDSSTLKHVLGAILLVFSIWKCYLEFEAPLWSFVEAIRRRCGHQTGLADAVPPKDAEADDEEGMNAPLLGITTDQPAAPTQRQPFTYRTIAVVVACAIGSGLMGGMFGVSGPPLMILITFVPLEKGPLRSTFIGIFALTNIPQAFFLYRRGLFSWAAAPSYAAVAVGALLGTAVGNALYKKMSAQMLLRGILFLLICSCLTLLELPNWVLLAFCTAFVIGTAGLLLANHFVSSPPATKVSTNIKDQPPPQSPVTPQQQHHHHRQ